MNKPWMYFAGIVVVGLILSHYTLWWIIAPITAIITLLMYPIARPWLAFLAGMAVWCIPSLVLSVKNDFRLTEMIAEIFSLPSGILLIFIASVINGLLSLLAAWSALSLKNIIHR